MRTITVSVRVLVATNWDPDELVRAGRLRSDLLHRVDVIRLTLPPLRERPDDVPRFVEHFLELHRRRGLPSRTLAPDALRVLQGYPWPVADPMAHAIAETEAPSEEFPRRT